MVAGRVIILPQRQQTDKSGCLLQKYWKTVLFWVLLYCYFSLETAE